jgi:hypothetical protein
VSPGTQYSFTVGTGDWSFPGISPCSGTSTCYNIHSVTVTVDNGATVSSSSHSWGGSASPVLTISATLTDRLGPVSVSYQVVVRRYQEEVGTTCCDGDGLEYNYNYQSHQGDTSMSDSKNVLLLPTGLSVHTAPSSSYTAASTTNVAVTLQLSPAYTVTTGHPFTAEMTAVSKAGEFAEIVSESNICCQ